MAGKMKVLRNRAGEYAIWPADRENALGWNDVGKTGTAEECQRYIGEVWTDLRSLSVRERTTRLKQTEQKILRDGR